MRLNHPGDNAIALDTTTTLWSKPTYTRNVAVPANNTLFGVTPTTVGCRWIQGYVSLTSAVAQPASIDIQIETAVASGVFDSHFWSVPAGLIVVYRFGFSLVVPSGFDWRYVVGGLAGAIETMTNLQTLDR